MAVKFADDNIAPVRDFLSTEFWSGKRWLSFDIQKQLHGVDDLHCFFDYQTATSFCYNKSTQGAEFRIRAIGPILKVLNKGRIRATIVERRLLQIVLTAYPIKYCLAESQTEEILLSGDFCPILWNKVINPLTTIRQYHIIERRLNEKGEQKRLLHSSFEEFASGMTQFTKLVKAAQTHRSNSEFLFLGQFNEYPFQPDHIDTTKNTGILFYRAFMDHLTDDQYQIEQINDPADPYLIRYGVFLRFDATKGRLLFFDGSLKKVLPGVAIEFIDPIYFGLDNGEVLLKFF